MAIVFQASSAKKPKYAIKIFYWVYIFDINALCLIL